MSADTSDHAEYAAWFNSAVGQARSGDRAMAEGLIREFAQLAKSPHTFDAVGGVPMPLVQYIARCLADWQSQDYKDAEHHFFVNRPANAPDQTGSQHVRAMRAYLLLRARGKGVESARSGAAAASGLSEDQVRHMLAKDKPEKPPTTATGQPLFGRGIGIVEAAALCCIPKRLRERVRNPPRKKYQRSR